MTINGDNYNNHQDTEVCIAEEWVMEKEREDYHSLRQENGHCSIDNTFCERQGPCSGCPTNKCHITLEQQIVELWNSRGVMVEEIRIQHIRKGRFEWTVVGKPE